MLELLQINRMQLIGLIVVLECLFLFANIKLYRRYEGKDADQAHFMGSIVWIMLSLITTFVLIYRDLYMNKEWISSSVLIVLIVTLSMSILLFVADKVLVKKYEEPFKISQKEIEKQEAQWEKQTKLR